jgi:hypothetical protein
VPALLGAFVVVTVLATHVHEMRVDDFQAWMIARDATSIGNLAARSRYEGHPLLWYVILWGVSKITRDPFVLQPLCALIGVANAFVLLRYAPFNLAARGALVFSYFIVFEYNVVPRSYGLGLLLLLLVCVAMSRPRRNMVLVGVLLALASLTTVYTLILAVALAAAIAIDEVVVRGRRLGTAANLTAAAVFAAATAIAAYEIWPRSDASIVTRVGQGQAGIGVPIVGQIWRAAVPIPHFDAHFWETNLFGFGHLDAVLGFALWCVVAAWLASRPAALALWAGGTFGLLLFSYLGYYGSTRHWGHYVLLGVLATWMRYTVADWPDRWSRAAAPLDRLAHRAAPLFTAVIAVVLAAQVVAAGSAIALDAKYPFSGAEAAADLIRARGWDDLPIVGYSDFGTSPVSAILDRPIYYPGSAEWGTYAVGNNNRHHYSPNGVLSVARRFTRNGTSVVVLLDTPATSLPPGTRFVEKFGAVAEKEDLYVYLVS